MKCSIYISGNATTKISMMTHIITRASDVNKCAGTRYGMFNAVYLDFNSKTDAYKALWGICKTLRLEKSLHNRHITGPIKYIKQLLVKFDDSTALIIYGNNYNISLGDRA